MPLLQIQASSAAPAAAMLKALSAELAQQLQKPEQYVMVSFQPLPAMLFGGSNEPACFAALKNIGTFTPDQTQKLSALLCKHLSQALGVAHDRIYLEFVNAEAHLWGYDGDTFA